MNLTTPMMPSCHIDRSMALPYGPCNRFSYLSRNSCNAGHSNPEPSTREQEGLTHEHGNCSAATGGPSRARCIHGNVRCNHQSKPSIPCPALHPVHCVEQRCRPPVTGVQGVHPLQARPVLLRHGQNRHEGQSQTPRAAEATFVAHLQAAVSMQEQPHVIKGRT